MPLASIRRSGASWAARSSPPGRWKVRTIVLWCVLAVLGHPVARAAESTASYGRFGKVHILAPDGPADEVFLVLSGDSGWTASAEAIGKAIAGPKRLVVGLDVVAYLKALQRSKRGCMYLAGELEQVSQWIQQKLGYPTYHAPVLVGYSSGATLVYAALVQAPPDTFRGAISFGFCPDLQIPHSVCAGRDLKWKVERKLGYVFEPSQTLENPWVALQGDGDKVCTVDQVEAWGAKVPRGSVTRLPGVGHGFKKVGAWMPAFDAALAKMPPVQRHAAAEVGDLPLVELPTDRTGDTLAVIITGDGGWAAIDREVGQKLHDRGIPVVALDALRYFWQTKAPEQAAADLQRVIRHYATAWSRQRVLLIGYSRGADVMPFLADRLPDDLRQRVRGVVLLAPSVTAEFEFHVSDWVAEPGKGHPVAPEVAKLAPAIPVVCVYGSDETDSLCPTLDAKKVRVVKKTGGHHLGGDYGSLADLALGIP
jgi:type IV secretory pathway VirJ component